MDTKRCTSSVCRMTLQSSLLVEVLSDWGLLELLLGELRKRAKIIRKAGIVTSAHSDLQQLPCVEHSERLLTANMLQVVSNLTLRSIKNTGWHVCDFNNRNPCFSVLAYTSKLNLCMQITVSVRDHGMVPYIKIFLDEDQYRRPTLSILEQLAEINPEEFMRTAIGALCSSTQQELGLKRDLLLVQMTSQFQSPSAAHTSINSQIHSIAELCTASTLHQIVMCLKHYN